MNRTQLQRLTRGGVLLYAGPSMLDGAPIIAVGTVGSSNPKTGPMLQTWILRADKSPMDAIRDSDDASVCGDCPLRHSLDGACYVQPFQAPRAVFAAYMRGNYAPWDGSPAPMPIRFGAYGDPAAVPTHVWRRLMPTRGHPHTGYTRRWRTALDLRPILMASVHNDAEQIEALAAGWRTFRVVPAGTRGTGMQCLATTSAKTACIDCLLCNGREINAPKRVWIAAHGARKARLLPVLTA